MSVEKLVALLNWAARAAGGRQDKRRRALIHQGGIFAVPKLWEKGGTPKAGSRRWKLREYYRGAVEGWAGPEASSLRAAGFGRYRP